MFTWPIPALLTWALAWGVYMALGAAGSHPLLAFVVALLVAAGAAWNGQTPWRRVFMMAGFPLSLVVSGAAAAFPAWAWLVPMLALLVLYPLNTWRDAPLFPTPTLALKGLASQVPLGSEAKVVDAGCGLGAGLQALRGEYPTAQLHGLEWSWPLTLACKLRCRFAQVRRADIWAADWSGYQLVYLFQRPESMDRARDKANREMPEGSWLVSLEFAIQGQEPHARLETVPGKPVWVYRLPIRVR